MEGIPNTLENVTQLYEGKSGKVSGFKATYGQGTVYYSTPPFGGRFNNNFGRVLVYNTLAPFVHQEEDTVFIVIRGEYYRLKLREGEELSIGRDHRQTRNAINLRNDSVSRQHAMIGRDNQGYYLLDKGSRFGTHINGPKIQPNQKKYITFDDFFNFGGEINGMLRKCLDRKLIDYIQEPYRETVH